MVNFVWAHSESKDIKLKNLLIIWALIWFISILFHFTVVFFFWLVLKSVFLVWIFLAVSNIISLILDIPIWVMQKYIKPKTFMVASWVMMVLATLVFFKFVYLDGITWIETKGSGNTSEVIDWSWKFFWSVFNVILLLVAASLYWLISETFWVTSYAYILDNTTPSEYWKYLSRYSIYGWAWSMVWLVLSWVLLAFNIKIALLIFIFLTFLFLIFVWKYFDNWKESISVENLKKAKLDSFKLDIWKSWKKITKSISTKNLMNLAKDTKLIFLKPLEMKNSINFDEIINITRVNFERFIKIIFKAPRNLMMFWVFFILMQFSFWDTFVATFLIDFLEELSKSDASNPILANEFVTWYVLLWIIAIPWFVLQDPFIKLAKKFWDFNILMFWTFTSWISLFLFWFFSENVTMILFLWIINSVWYAAAIAIWQWLFSERYNVLYAVRNDLKQIDSTVSAAPLKMVLNLANVVWLFFGSLIVSTMWFKWFFISFWLLLLGLFAYSIVFYKKINEAWKEWEWLFLWEDENSDLTEFDGEVFKD